MDNTREKLTELIASTQRILAVGIRNGKTIVSAAIIADHLAANGVTVQRWIPVSERLPDRNGRYLCRYVFNDHYDMSFEQVISYYATDKKPHFQNEGDGLGMKVTHWMPLPEPPREG